MWLSLQGTTWEVSESTHGPSTAACHWCGLQAAPISTVAKQAPGGEGAMHLNVGLLVSLQATALDAAKCVGLLPKQQYMQQREEGLRPRSSKTYDPTKQAPSCSPFTYTASSGKQQTSLTEETS